MYLQHEYTGHNIGAEQYESDVTGSVVLLSFHLKPVDSNQKHDEEYLHSKDLVSLAIDDGTVIDGFIRHVESSDENVSTWKIQVISKNKKLEFITKQPVLNQIHQYRTLTFTVLNNNG